MRAETSSVEKEGSGHGDHMDPQPHWDPGQRESRPDRGLPLSPGGDCWSPTTATEEGLRAWSRSVWRSDTVAVGLGQRRSDWHRGALSAYTWLRTGRGPQKAWLHRTGKADEPSCPCGLPREDGTHITFSCPMFRKERRGLIAPHPNGRS